MALGPSVGILGTAISGASQRIGNGVIGASVCGLLFHLFFVWGQVALVHQVWQRRPYKKTKEMQHD
jgi:hypothetical protein